MDWDENDMHVVQNVEFSEEIIKSYKHYDKNAYEQCQMMLNEISKDGITEDEIDVIYNKFKDTYPSTYR